MISSIAKIISVVFAASFLAGCMQPKFGARLCTMNLTSQTPADAYLIPEGKYITEIAVNSTEEVCKKVATRYRGTTPCTVRILPYEWIYLAQDTATHQWSKPVTFNPNTWPTSSVDADFTGMRK